MKVDHPEEYEIEQEANLETATTPCEKNWWTENRVTRRGFLGGFLSAAVGALLAACGAEADGSQEDTDAFAQRYDTATPDTVLQSPQARPGAGTPQPGTPQPTAPEGVVGLEEFLALSAVLTGVSNLDPVLGRVYLGALQSGDFGVSLAELYQQAGFEGEATAELADLQEAGVFEEEATRTLANTITRYWYTGVYDTAEGEQAVATYVDALAWKVLPWTKPRSICGSRGFWEQRPDVVIPRDPNPTATPTPSATPQS